MKYLTWLISLMLSSSAWGQNLLVSNPLEATFITSDIPRFWEAFDKIDSTKNPFIHYLEEGSPGLKDFIPYRIESPKNLLKTVKKLKGDYESKREKSYQIGSYVNQIQKAYNSFKDHYSKAVYPSTYFVIGAYNAGGTISDNGLIIGVERVEEFDLIPITVAHELIHFNQNYEGNTNTLLAQSIREGSADFIGELISGKHMNELAFKYGSQNEKALCSEFVIIMNDSKYHGWLYGSKGKKKGRPNDLVYWIGYKICQAYYNKSLDKKEAIDKILTIKNFDDFLKDSGYLANYITN